MSRKITILLVGLALLVIGTYAQKQADKSRPKSNIQYDYAIKAQEGVPIKVVQAIDGDTVELINGQRLRYVGIDTPEEFDERKPVQCFAHKAAEKNRELVSGHMVTFHKDVTATDMYGRLLGYVYLEDGTFVNLEMVKQGFAFSYVYPPDVAKTEIFRKAETEARTQKLGLWNACETYKTSSGRMQTEAAN